MRLIVLFIAIGLLILLIGCETIGGHSSLDSQGVDTWGQPKSESVMDIEGNQTAAYIGESPTQVKLDDAGIFKITGGKTRTAGINPSTGQLFLDSSEDVEIDLFVYTPSPEPGQESLRIEGLRGRQTELTQASVIGLQAGLSALEGMTKEQATVVIEKWKTAGVVTESVAKGIIEGLFPGQ